MKMIEHHLDLEGPGCYGKYAKPKAIGLVLSRIDPCVRESVRMSILHSSRLAGRPVRELSKAWDIQYGGQTKGPQDQTRLIFRAPTLAAAAPKLFEQGTLFEDGPKAGDTAFDLLGDVVADVAAMKRDSQRFDADLLGTLTRYAAVFHKGVQSIRLGGHRLDNKKFPRIDKALTDAAAALVLETPIPKRVRIAGRLNMIRVSDRAFELVLNDGQPVRAVWTEQSVVSLRDFLDQQVVVEGQAIFRASGSLLRIDAEAIAGARKQDDFFSKLPRPAANIRRQIDRAKVPVSGHNGFAAIYGKWPGDETDAEILAALEEMG